MLQTRSYIVLKHLLSESHGVCSRWTILKYQNLFRKLPDRTHSWVWGTSRSPCPRLPPVLRPQLSLHNLNPHSTTSKTPWGSPSAGLRPKPKPSRLPSNLPPKIPWCRSGIPWVCRRWASRWLSPCSDRRLASQWECRRWDPWVRCVLCCVAEPCFCFCRPFCFFFLLFTSHVCKLQKREIAVHFRFYIVRLSFM